MTMADLLIEVALCAAWPVLELAGLVVLGLIFKVEREA